MPTSSDTGIFTTRCSGLCGERLHPLSIRFALTFIDGSRQLLIRIWSILDQTLRILVWCVQLPECPLEWISFLPREHSSYRFWALFLIKSVFQSPASNTPAKFLLCIKVLIEMRVSIFSSWTHETCLIHGMYTENTRILTLRFAYFKAQIRREPENTGLICLLNFLLKRIATPPWTRSGMWKWRTP